jgi:Type II secretory pathway, component PulD
LTVGAGGNVSESINYVNVGINLTVLPEINAHTENIKIKIAPEVSYINGYKGKNNDIPVVRTRRVNTTVLVKNNNTVLIGGLFKSSDQDSVSRVPLLSRFPFLGRTFKSNKQEDEQTELVIAITPKIIDDTFQELVPVPLTAQKMFSN